MNAPISPESSAILNQVVSQVAQGEVRGLKQLSQAERKAVKCALVHLIQDDHQPIALDSKISNKISKPKEYHRNPVRSFFKGIARRLFSSYIDTESLAKFISDNSALINKHINPNPIPASPPPPQNPPPSPAITESIPQQAPAEGSLVAPVATKNELPKTPSPEDTEQPTALATSRLPSTATNLNLSNLDYGYRDIQSMAKGLTANFPPKIPQVTFSAEEKDNLSKAQNALTELEEHLKNKNGADFEKLGWHGRLSFQRIIWQDEKFVQAIKDPLVVKLILSSAKNGTEAPLGGGNSLSGLMLYGLGSNRLSYLVSAAPNWDNKPAGVGWNHLEDMGLSRNNVENPWKVTPGYIQDLQAGLDSIRTVFTSSGVTAPADEMAPVHEKINNASVSELINAFNVLIDDDDKIYNLTAGAAGASTEPNRMAGQCFEVMASYNEALALNNGDHSAVLGYGLVSHALDARHLAAALYVNSNNGKYYNRIVNRYGQDSPIFNGANTLKELLKNASEGRLDADTTSLLKIRLQQVITLIMDNPTIGLASQDIFKTLT